MKKHLLSLLLLIPFLSLAQTAAETTARNSVATLIPDRLGRPNGYRASDVRGAMNAIITYSATKADTTYVKDRTAYVTPEQFGTVSDTDASLNTILFAKAAATGKTIVLGKRIYKGNWVLKKQLLIGQGYSPGWGAGNEAATIIQGTVTLLAGGGIRELNVENSTTHGVLFRGFAASAINVGVHNCAGNGFDLTGGDADNINHWRLESISATYNQRGVLIDNVTTNPNLPNANVGTALNLDLRGNTGDGLTINRAIDNSFYGVTAEENGGIGIRLLSYAKGNRFYTPYTEANTLGQIQLDAGSANNRIDGYRSGTVNEEITNNGTNNVIIGKIYGVDRTKLQTVDSLQFIDYDEGRWMTTKTNQNLIFKATNTSLNAKVLYTHTAVNGVIGIGFKTGGNHATVTGYAAKEVFIDFGSVSPGATVTSDVPMAEVASYNWTMNVQPHTKVLPSGIILQCFFKNAGTVSVRVTNASSSTVAVGGMALWINAMQLSVF